MNNFKISNGGVPTNKRPRWGNRYAALKVDKVITILAITADIDIASKETGIAPRTIQRWLQQDSAFNEKLRFAKREVFEPGYSLLRIEFPKTVKALVEMRDNLQVSDAVRLGAMRTLMEYGKQVDTMDHYDGKLEQLEAKTINAVDTPIPEASDNNDAPITHEWWKDQPQDWQQ